MKKIFVGCIEVLSISTAVFMVGLWQIEEIWRSVQNNWLYHLPFGYASSNYWLAHDYILVIMGFVWFIQLFVAVVLGFLIARMWNDNGVDALEEN